MFPTFYSFESSKIYFQICFCGEDKIPKCKNINNLSDMHCITLMAKTGFSRYFRIIFDKKSFGQKFGSTINPATFTTPFSGIIFIKTSLPSALKLPFAVL